MSDLSAPVALPSLAEQARVALGKRNLIFVGLMGAGKSVIGRLTAQALSLPFVDTDAEIERVSRMTVTERLSSSATWICCLWRARVSRS